MANVVKNQNGSLYVMQDASADHDAARRANAAAAKQAAKLEAEIKKRREAEARKTVSADERRQMICTGLDRVAKRAKRTGDSKAPQLEKLAADASKALREYAESAPAQPKDPYADAALKAAKELKKVLPNCFTTLEDAELFAKKMLPLSDARKASIAAADRLRKWGREQHLKKREFWNCVEQACRLLHYEDAKPLAALGDI